jgi:anhydro-N-acetylmuramic acid kinase
VWASTANGTAHLVRGSVGTHPGSPPVTPPSVGGASRGPVDGLFAGLMSGTSLDGVDAIVLDIRGGDPFRIEWSVAAFGSVPYEAAERARIRDAIESGGVRDLALLDRDLAEWFVRALTEVLADAGLAASDLVAVGSHGQTVWHEPPGAEGPGTTLQLGDAATIAEALAVPVVSDLRSADVAAGGHGAPLVPWGDWVLLRRPDTGRALQNLGGMGNVTFLPADGSRDGVLGFDTGPGVALIDRTAALASEGRDAWDRDGVRAARGRVDEPLLARLADDPFFRTPPPRSTGRERFGDALVATLVADVHPSRSSDWDDLLATLTRFTAWSVADAYRRFLPMGRVDEVVLTGGGARNPSLVTAIAEALAPMPVRTGAEALGIDPDAREAAAFALLAWARLNGIAGNVPAVTGAAGLRVLGALHEGRGARGG